MERSNSMKGKRKLDLSQADDEEEDQPPAAKKRPTFASVILEASKMDHLLKLLDPLIRRMVGEAVELAFSKFCLADVTGRCSTKQIEGPYQRNLQLHFRSRLSLPLFTERKVEGEQGATINVALLDATTGSVVTSGLESSVKLDVVVLEGDFNNEDDENWTMVEFESHVVKEREGKRPLLIGDLQVTLKEGVGTLGDLTFTDNSSWTRSKKFRIGLKVASGRYEGIRIREAKTDAFSVKHHRAVAKKHCPPALDDEVFRLKKIGKDGKFHKRLQEAGICTVKDFLLLLERNPNSLKHILGKGMSNKIWEVLVGHSKTCILNGNYPADSLSYGLMVDADGLVKKAYDNRVSITQYDGNKIINLNQPNTDFRRTPDGTFNAHVSPLCFPVPIIPEQPTMEAGLPPGGTSCNENQSLRNDSIVGLALGSSHSSISGFHNDFPSNLPTNSTSNDKWSAIREVGVGLNHDTMSQSCCTVSEGLPSYLDVTVNGYSVSLGVPSQQNCSQGQLRSSRKGVPNWLKLKAVIMWGICVRNEAAAKKEEWESWMAEFSFPDGFT